MMLVIFMANYTTELWQTVFNTEHMKRTILSLAAGCLGMASFAQVPTTSNNVVFSGGLTSLRATTTSTVTALHEQLTGLGAGYTSQNFETGFDAYDNTAADDFTVPTGATWKIDSIFVHGVYWNGTGPSDSAYVTIYSNSGALPGTPIYSAKLNGADPDGDGQFTIRLTTPAILSPGTYWLGVVARMDFSPYGQWGWTNISTLQGNPAVWQNPGGGFEFYCSTWGLITSCLGATGPDMAFGLYSVGCAEDAGADSAFTLCATESAYNLTSALTPGYTTGGVFTDLDGSGGLSGSTLNCTGITPGTYHYSYIVGLGDCADTAFLEITIQRAPVAGVGGTLTPCNTTTSLNLTTGLTGSPDPGGFWLDLDGSGALAGSTFNPSVAGVGTWHFRYLVSGAPFCADATTDVTVDVVICTAVDLSANGEVKMYPNPVAGKLNIETPFSFGLTSIKVTDLPGAVVLNMGLTGEKVELDLTALPAGTYLIHVTGAQGTRVHRIVRN